MCSKFIKVVFGAGLAMLAPLAARAADCDANAKTADLDFVVKDVNGEDVALSDYKGRVILLDFWATWCAPCRIEIPGFIELHDKYGPQGLSVLGVSVDDPVPAIQSFAAEFEIDYPLLVGAERDDVKDAFGPPVGFPTTLVIARDGTICSSHTGFAPKETFEQEVQALL
jgi:thiol-disulfide isomerase/thioredoxin